MLFNITHRTCYHYSAPVFLEPMIVRLRPHCNATQTLHSYDLNVTPTPSGIANCIEFDGNSAENIWFSGQHNTLEIEAHSLVETHHGDPFNFFITDSGALNLPIKYLSHIEPMIAHYKIRDKNDAQVESFAEEIMRMTKYETIPFLSKLAEQMPKRIKYMLREHGDPWNPGETLKKGCGSCRDLAMLFVDICRSVGMAARFVSGYCIDEESAENYMHAWAEIYLPGAGWRGYDPSQGISTLDNHITVSAGHRSQNATPISGNFRGKAEASLETFILIKRLESKVTAT